MVLEVVLPASQDMIFVVAANPDKHARRDVQPTFSTHLLLLVHTGSFSL